MPLREHVLPVNLIVNGDFSDGDEDFTSGYTYETPNGTVQTTVGEYSVVSNPSTAFTNGYSSYGDHTSGSGQMLFVDGATGPAFWQQSVSLAANTIYTFSYFVTGADSTNLPDVQVTVNTSAIDSGFQVSDAGGTWQQVTETFETSDAGPYAIAMSDLNGAGEGNDFTIDDISLTAACYARGTHISTARGEIPIERLAIGDRVLTASGATRPVIWLGHRAIDISRHPDPVAVRPVRVRAGAFGDGQPRRDLWLSPGHNIAFEGALIAACRLINGRSVGQIDQDHIEYWHVELDAHDVIYADGLPAESYLDTGNRTAFANGGAFIEAHPDFRPRHWAETCLPLVIEGTEVVAAKARLLSRLAERGYGVDGEADAHVWIDGLRVEPIRLSETRLAFALPSGGARCSYALARSSLRTRSRRAAIPARSAFASAPCGSTVRRSRWSATRRARRAGMRPSSSASVSRIAGRPVRRRCPPAQRL